MLPRLEEPIILVHGLFGFDRIQVGAITVANYFPCIVEALQGAGNRVFVPCLSPTEGIEHRAAQLKDFLRRTCPYDKVHLIAHSMGGLDSRHMITHLRMGEHVASLTTLGTPHRGSPVADWALTKVEWLVKPALQTLRLPHQAFYDLTTHRCREFHARTPDIAGVRYYSVGAEHDGSLEHPEWLLPYSIVLEQEGPNDGVVSLVSARHGDAFDIWPGDHFSLVNWDSPRSVRADTLQRWKRLLDRIADKPIGSVSDEST